MQAKVEVIRKLDIYKPYGEYFAETHDDFLTHHSYHFPIVLLKDGSPWPDGNRYLQHKTKGIMPAKHRTLDSIARDLIDFRRWLDIEDINYLQFPKRVMARPTYRFCGHLHDEIRSKKISINTAKKKMSSIQGFYRWLKLEGHSFASPYWRENDAFILFKNQHGFNRSKNITTTDLCSSFRNSKNTNNYSEHIADGGKLRPLPKEQQEAIVKALKTIGNTEMTLSFLIALSTGARLQTVFTLRLENFEIPLPPNTPYRTIKAGSGTLVNTKFSKPITILIPTWLYRKVQIYLKSKRHIKRLNKSPHIYTKENEQYAFLTRNGLPYYMADNDPFEFLYRTPARGNGVTQFIRQQLQPTLKQLSYKFEFRFHDLRATFGINLLEQKIKEENLTLTNDRNSPVFFRVLMYIKERMGHSSINTTMLYLNYKENFKIATQIQTKFELYLEQLLND